MRLVPLVVAAALAASAPLPAQNLNILGDLVPGATGSDPAEFVDLDGAVIFAATHPTLGRELWISDGTAAGTTLLLDINPGAAGSLPEGLVRAGDLVFFWAFHWESGFELWRTDGTAAGTLLVKDIQPGSSGQSRERMAVIGSSVYFSGAEGPTNVAELWTSDGTPAGTVQVADINPGAAGSWPAELVVLGSAVYFSAFEPTTGRELWKFEGGTASLVTEIVAGTGSPNLLRLTSAGGLLYFLANQPGTGLEPWRSDGTAPGTMLLGDLAPGPAHTDACCFTAAGSWVFFTASNATFGIDLWRTDGSAPGTQMLLEPAVGPDPSRFAGWNGRLYFEGVGPGGEGGELWSSDGTDAGTVLVADILPGASGSFPQYFVALGDRLYFAATHSTTGRDLWRTDGTTAGTEIFANLNGNSSSDPLPTAVSATRILFSAFTDSTGVEPWIVELPPPVEDFGDAPDPGYPTLLASDGARHEIGLLWLGGVPDVAPDAEPDGLPSAAADGDDLDGDDDEDGVAFLDYLVEGGTTRLRVTATCEPEFGPCAPHLDAWIDFDANGDWGDTGEQVFTAVALAEGENLLEFDTPLGAALGPTYTRFRLSQLGGLLPFGGATDGEVEDYAVDILPTPVYDGDFDDGTFGDWIVVTP
jgi:ELWxxDGT repeat protein